MTLMTFEIDEESYEEIISILAKNGRPDLISELRDTDYKPPLRVRREILSDTEGSAEEESDYEVEMDEEGFFSLK